DRRTGDLRGGARDAPVIRPIETYFARLCRKKQRKLARLPENACFLHCGCRSHLLQSTERGSRLTTNEETSVALTCPSCGNDQNFLVKTLQMHVVHLDDSRIEVSEEGRPAVLEVLCDECETALSIDEIDEVLRKELLLTLGAR